MRFSTLEILAEKSTRIGSAGHLPRLTGSLLFFVLAIIFLVVSALVHWAALDAAVLFLVLAGWALQSAGYELRLQVAEDDSRT